jgi:lyso-ornithine lipid O-acyltransferase
MPTLRTTMIAGLLVVAVVALLPFQLMAVAFRWPLQRLLPRMFHRLACALIGIRITVKGTPPGDATTLIVANHVSWIDILAISATTPAVFVAKQEISSWPLFGVLARLQRAVFVDRGRRSATADVATRIASRLGDGDHVVLFAEGTSSDGRRVLPFKSALIGAAGHAVGADGGRSPIAVQPLSIVYTGLDGMRLDRHQRWRIAWYGDMPLLPHLVRVLGRGAIDVTLSWGAPVAYGADSDRKAITRVVETAVRTLTSAALRAA